MGEPRVLAVFRPRFRWGLVLLRRSAGSVCHVGLAPSNRTSPKGAAKPTYFSLRAHRLPGAPPRGNAEYDEPSLVLHALYVRESVGWVTGRPHHGGGWRRGRP